MMHRRLLSSFLAPAMLAVLVIMSGGLLLVAAATGTPVAADPVKTVQVDCSKGERIARALEEGDERKPMLVAVRGICNENVLIERDDVTLQGDPGAAVVGTAPDASTIVVDGARRVAILNLTVSGGGRHGVSAFRGATVDLGGCRLEHNAQFGVAASFGAVVIADGCVIQQNGTAGTPPIGGGAVASNGGQLVLTNSTVQNNTGNGVTAARAGTIRLGQDFRGGLTPGPVTVSGNTGSGVVVTDTSAGIVVGGTVTGNQVHGVAVNGSSSAQIGTGLNGLAAGVTITGNGGGGGLVHGVTVFQGSRALVSGSLVDGHPGDGVRVEGGAVTVVASTVRNSGRYGVEVSNGGSARLGITDSGGPSSNTIELSGLDGVHVVSGGSVWMFGNTVQNNGAASNRWGVLAVEQSVVRLVGLNVVQNNGGAGGGGGVFLRDASLHVLRGDFTIGPNTNDIVDNTGDGIQAMENATIDMRDGVNVTGNTAHGIFLIHGSRMRAQGAVIAGGAAPALQLFAGSTARFGPAPVTITGAVVCNDAESSVLGIPLPSGCTGF